MMCFREGGPPVPDVSETSLKGFGTFKNSYLLNWIELMFAKLNQIKFVLWKKKLEENGA